MSKKFSEYKKFDLSKINKEIQVFWKVNRIFEKSVESREDKPSFVFNEGPPSANGRAARASPCTSSETPAARR